MPAKNVIRFYETDSYYHVYNRGVAKQKIFLDTADKDYFLRLMDRHLNPHSELFDGRGVPYPKFDQKLELLSYCLMDNHYHLLLYLKDDLPAITDLMRSLSTAYTMYFNLKYDRVGPLFQGRFKASKISSDSYLTHISRYIHLNPNDYLNYPYSSLPAYLGTTMNPWLQPQRILSLFSPDECTTYLAFLKDYESDHTVIQGIKSELANE